MRRKGKVEEEMKGEDKRTKPKFQACSSSPRQPVTHPPPLLLLFYLYRLLGLHLPHLQFHHLPDLHLLSISAFHRLHDLHPLFPHLRFPHLPTSTSFPNLPFRLPPHFQNPPPPLPPSPAPPPPPKIRVNHSNISGLALALPPPSPRLRPESTINIWDRPHVGPDS